MGIGDTVTVEWPATGEVDLEVAVIYEENGLVGDWVTSLETYDANVAQVLDLFVLIKAEPGAPSPRSSRTSSRRSRSIRTSTCRTRASFRDMYADFLNQLLNSSRRCSCSR